MNDGIKFTGSNAPVNNNNNMAIGAQKDGAQNFNSKQYNSSDIVNRFIKFLMATKGRQKQDSQDETNIKNKVFNFISN